MTKKYNIAVVGATGVVGNNMISILAQRQFPVGNIYPLASERSAGTEVEFNGTALTVGNVDDFDFSKADLAFFSAGNPVSEKYAPIAAAAGCIVIDNSSHFRYEDDIPLVVPEVNPQALDTLPKRLIIANPNCSTIQMLVALKPIYDTAGIARIDVATYQAVSGGGKQGIDELYNQSSAIIDGQKITSSEVFPKPIAFDVVPQVDVFLDNDYTKEEMKLVWETKKIFADESICVNPTAVRVPVSNCHSEAIHIDMKQPMLASDVKGLLAATTGITVIDSPKDQAYPTASAADGKDDVFVGRIRNDLDSDTGLNLWVVADNVRKGAALNSIQIAELLLAKKLI